jgi:D-alanine-D-alanine ligase
MTQTSREQSPSPIVLFGGTSSERKVSVASAQNVSRVWPEAHLLFWAPTGDLSWVKSDALQGFTRPFEQDFVAAQRSAFASIESALDAVREQSSVLLIALHGGDGENGMLQRLCEARDISFTGSGSKASATAFDKSASKALIERAGFAVPKGMRLQPQPHASLAQQVAALFDVAPRWVLKPERDGSSVGLLHLKSVSQKDEAAQMIQSLDVVYLAEQFVAGREVTVGVVESAGKLKALPVSEVCLKPEAAFDFEGKYLKNTEEKTPADLPESLADLLQQVAVTAHRALGCFGYSRTDIILSADGPVYLETNTLPGLTKASFIPQQLAVAGDDFRAFLEAQVSLAKNRSAR